MAERQTRRRTVQGRAPRQTRERRVLAFEWRVWAAEALARGTTREAVEKALRARGVPRAEAARRLDEVLGSAAFHAARTLARTAMQHELLARLGRETRATALGGIERRAGVGPDELFERYYATNTPVVLTDVVTTWPAFRKWTPEYLKKKVGGVTIAVTDGRESDPDYDMKTKEHTREVKLGDFVDRLRRTPRSNDFYAVAQNQNIDRPELQVLWKDVKLDPELLRVHKLEGGAALWLGPAGTITPLHHDTSNIFFGQIHGRKRFVLAAPQETALWAGARGFYAAGYPDAPAFREVRFHTVDLAPGEALFLPVAWWHHVEALDVSISLAFTAFTRPNWFDWYRPGHL